MIMNMNEKGRQTKLFAAIAVLAMVVCALAVVMPSDVSATNDVPVEPTAYDGEIDAVADFDDLSPGDYKIVKSISISGSTTNVTIPAGVNVYIADGVKVTIANDAGTISINGNVYVMSGGEVTYQKEISGTGSIYVCYGAKVAGPVDGDDIGAEGQLKIVDSSSFIEMKMIESAGRAITAYGTVTAANALVGTNDELIVAAGAKVSGTFTGSGDIVSNALLDDGTTKTYYGTAGDVTLADGQTYTLYDGSAKVSNGNNSITFTNIVSEDGITVGKTAGSAQMTVGGTVGTPAAGTSMSVAVSGAVRTANGGFDNGDASMNVVTSGMISNNGTIVSNNFKGITDIVSGATTFRIYGNVQDDVTFTNTAATTYVMAGSSFDGSIAYNDGEDTTTFFDGEIIASSDVTVAYVEEVTAAGSEAPAKVSITSTGVVTFGDIQMSSVVILGTGTDAILPAGSTMSFGTDGEFQIADNEFTIGGDLYAANPDHTQITKATTNTNGKVYTFSTNVAFVEQYTNFEVDDWAPTVTTAQQFIDAVESGSKDIIIGSSGTAANIVLGTDCDVNFLELDGVKVTVYGSITVGGTEDFSLIISNRSTITDGSIGTDITSMGSNSITVRDGSSMEINTSYLYINVKAETGSTVTSVNNQYSSGSNIPGSVMVGYGSEYTLTGSIDNNQYIKVWGTLIVPENGTLTVSEGAVVSTASGATINVIGEMTVAGTVNIADEATFDVDGTVSVANTNGNAIFNNGGKVVVDGVFNVSAPNTGRPANLLNAGSDFTVNGSMIMAGTLSGAIKDKGTVTVNGSTDATNGAKIYVYDGVTLQVTSVTGKLEISDKDVAKDIYGDGAGNYKPNVAGNVSDGNMITLTNVKGVTVSVQIDSTVKDDKRYVYSDMYVSGTITLIDDDAETPADDVILGFDVSAPVTVNKDKGQIYIDAATVIGKNMNMSVQAGQSVTVTSNATVTVTAEKAGLSNKGTLTVEGVITFGHDAKDGINGTTVNAVRYAVTDKSTGDVTTTYTNFAAALDAVDTADSKTVYVLGNVKVSADDTVAAGQNIQITGTLEIAKDVTLTVDNGGKVSGGSAVITVKGTFTSANFLADIGVRTITADVIVDNAPARTYTSLANALADAGEGDVITLNGNVVISENTAIPAGVTVKSDYNVNITENAVLSVAGTLDISVKGTLTNVQTDDYDSTTDRLGSVTVTGTVAIVGDAEPAVLGEVSGAHYSKSVGAVDTFYVSSLAIAAQNVDENISATIKVIGTVTSDAVAFTAPEGFGVLTISVQDYGTSTDDKKTVVSVSSMTLDGVKLSIASGASYSGTVTAVANGATASVELDRVGNIDIQSVGVEGAEGVTDYLTISSASDAFTGTVDIVAGTVTVATVSSGTSLAAGSITAGGENARMTVGSEATLSVRTGSSVTVGCYGSYVNYSAGLIVDGTMEVKGTLTVMGTQTVKGIMDVNGTLEVSESVNTTGVIVNGILNITGTMNISDELGKEGNVVVNYIMTVGSKPTSIGADGTVTGEVDLGTSGYVKVYSGTVESIVDGASAAESTALYINGALYMTIYGNGTILGVVAYDDIELSGLTTPPMTGDGMIKFYSDEECKNEVNGVTDIGVYENIYTKFASAYVYGTVSEGTGFTLFIDGVPASNYDAGKYPLTVGTHTVSYDMVLGYNGDAAQLTFNGQAIQSGATITITADMDTFSIVVTGAVPADIGGSNEELKVNEHRKGNKGKNAEVKENICSHVERA